MCCSIQRVSVLHSTGSRRPLLKHCLPQCVAAAGRRRRRPVLVSNAANEVHVARPHPELRSDQRCSAAARFCRGRSGPHGHPPTHSPHTAAARTCRRRPMPRQAHCRHGAVIAVALVCTAAVVLGQPPPLAAPFPALPPAAAASLPNVTIPFFPGRSSIMICTGERIPGVRGGQLRRGPRRVPPAPALLSRACLAAADELLHVPLCCSRDVQWP